MVKMGWDTVVECVIAGQGPLC